MTSIKSRTERRLETKGGAVTIHWIGALDEAGLGQTERLPRSIKVLLESCLRHFDGEVFREAHIEALANYDGSPEAGCEIPFMPGRVLLQDLTGVPALVDLAAMRSAMVRMGGDPARINPSLRVDLVVDHSIQVDAFGSHRALGINRRREFERNGARYGFLKWGAEALDNLNIIPPGVGIVHQVNLEHLAEGVVVDGSVAVADTVVGTDSHTTMTGGLGVVGWGVGGIEAEAAMLGQPISMVLPEVVGVRLTGRLPEGATATDMVLRVTELLRAHGVVGKFVEFHGQGLDHLEIADRATIANMAPEYGATVGFFPVDGKTLDYMALTGRSPEQIDLVEKHARRQGLWRDDEAPIAWSSELHLDLATIQPALAGPTRPQDRVLLGEVKARWSDFIGEARDRASVEVEGESFELASGAVVIAAITSCTNTSNPSVMLAAGLVAKKAHALGLSAKPWVKTSLAPGSQVVSDYLDKAGLTEPLDAVGFHTVGYGCTTCIGNSGPLAEPIAQAIESEGLAVASVLSGNRNFEGRVSPHTRGNFLASPPLVVAYALAGTVDIDLQTEALGVSGEGVPVYLRDIWPTNAEIEAARDTCVDRAQFLARYHSGDKGPEAWQVLDAPEGDLFEWSEASTWLREPPFFVGLDRSPSAIEAISGARCLVKVGDSITTDHISPAGAIPGDSPAADWLRAQGVEPWDFNTYGSRRGNDRVMVRGTFGNVRLRNHLAKGVEGGHTTWLGPDSEGTPTPGALCTIYDASVAYKAQGIPLVVLAGEDYGMGSSRDWAAKGALLLGVKAVIARSFERIHRTNLIGMGILPLEIEAEDLRRLSGREAFDIEVDVSLAPGQAVRVSTVSPDGIGRTFVTRCRIDTPAEVEIYRHGGILHMVLRDLLDEASR